MWEPPFVLHTTRTGTARRHNGGTLTATGRQNARSVSGHGSVFGGYRHPCPSFCVQFPKPSFCSLWTGTPGGVSSENTVAQCDRGTVRGTLPL